MKPTLATLAMFAVVLGSGCAGNHESSTPASIPQEFQGAWQSRGCQQDSGASSRTLMEIADTEMVQTLNQYDDAECKKLSRTDTAHYTVESVEDLGDKGIKVQLKEENDLEEGGKADLYKVALRMRLKSPTDLELKVADKEGNGKSAATLAELIAGKSGIRVTRAR